MIISVRPIHPQSDTRGRKPFSRRGYENTNRPAPGDSFTDSQPWTTGYGKPASGQPPPGGADFSHQQASRIFNMTHLPQLVVLLAAALVFATIVLTCRARMKYIFKAPAGPGPPGFERAYRVQMSTLEQTVLFRSEEH